MAGQHTVLQARGRTARLHRRSCVRLLFWCETLALGTVSADSTAVLVAVPCSHAPCHGLRAGHLGASLGVVELTVALHYVFNAPDDKARTQPRPARRCICQSNGPRASLQPRGSLGLALGHTPIGCDLTG